MVTTDICREIAAGMGQAFTCSQVNGYVRVRTPFVYPDGKVIDLYVKGQGDACTVSDLGETMRWLDAHSWSDKRTRQQDQLAQQVCLTLGVEQFRGMLQTRAGGAHQTADAVSRIAQAAARVADISFTFRVQLAATVRDEVEEFLQAKEIPYERTVQRVGASGKQWTLDFQTRTEGQTSLVQVLTTESRAASARITDHMVATWYDLTALKEAREDTIFVSLFDDTADVWKAEDFRLLEGLSRVALWSNPEEFAAQLAA